MPPTRTYCRSEVGIVPGTGSGKSSSAEAQQHLAWWARAAWYSCWCLWTRAQRSTRRGRKKRPAAPCNTTHAVYPTVQTIKWLRHPQASLDGLTLFSLLKAKKQKARLPESHLPTRQTCISALIKLRTCACNRLRRPERSAA